MRLFVAICLSDEIKDSLCDTIEELRSVARRGRFTYRENLHLTMVFIGETSRVDDILDVMEDVAAEFFTEAIPLTLTSPGVFRGRSGDLHWVGVENTPELKRLAKALAAGLAAEGFPIEKRRFTPHITIAREVVIVPPTIPEVKGIYPVNEKAPGAAAGQASNTPADIRVYPASMLADHISLMRSERINGRLVYTEIAAVPCG